MAVDIKNMTLVPSRGDGTNTACIMTARALLDSRAFSDEHPSATLRTIGIRINDGQWWDSDEERTRVLMPLVLDERLCASQCDASQQAEAQRARLASDWALTWATPFALDQAVLAMKSAGLSEQTALLQGIVKELRDAPDASRATTAAFAATDCARAASRAAPCVATAAAAAAYNAADAAAYAVRAYVDADDAYAVAAKDVTVVIAYTTNAINRAADTNTRAATERRKMRDSVINLFCRMLAVGAA